MKVWNAFMLSSILQIAGIPKWTLDDATQPIIFLASQLIVIFFIMVRSKTFDRVSA